MLRKFFLFLMALVGLALSLPAAADDDDHERAREALEAGEVLPLTAILERLRSRYPGDVLEVELERNDGRWLYEIKLLQPGGKLLKLEVDARDARVIERRSRAGSDRKAGHEERR